ncbi:hypothetical protein [Hydrogenimonas urashimensis]|uniref:hypothetical protein n=1 Tax=Hydrogenimonas urashimensis TaxID=2740515 RepID=UPI001915CFD3|nr:hypothetical protein [Hydrogenimonas urashimensis]
MKLYYYINTGHRVGLDRLRRSAPVISALRQIGVDVTMLTNDFRAGEYAKEHLGIEKYVSVDVVRNIANIATPEDTLVFDSQEENRAMWDAMAAYFRGFVRVSDDPEDFISAGEGLISSMKSGEGILTVDIVNPRYFESGEYDGGTWYFWGDDDYERRLLALADAFCGLDVSLLEGYYFFLQYGDELGNKFKRVEDSERYDEILMRAECFLSSSPQSVLEAMAAGARPVYIQKPGIALAWKRKMQSVGVPVVEDFSAEAIAQAMAETFVINRKVLRKDAALEAAHYIKDKLS